MGNALVPWAIGIGWGCVLFVGAHALLRRVGPGLVQARGVRVLAGTARRRDARRRAGAVARELPVLVDLLGMALAAGCPPPLAVDLSVPWSPPAIRDVFGSVTHRTESFATALTAAGADDPDIRRVADALLTSERTGAPVGPALTRLADQLRAETRRRAETRARSVPVRLLFPLVFLVLPAFVLLTVVPAISVAFTR